MNTRTFALILGIAFLVIGIGGFIPGLTVYEAGAPPAATTGGDPAAAPGAVADVGEEGFGYLMGLFPVNALHNLFHILWGVFGLAAYRSFGGARTYARATAVVYGVLTVLGLIPGLNTVFGLLPIYGHDVWLHGLIAIAAAYFGFAAPSRVEEPVGTTAGATTARRV
jgi:hypothetical protein